MDNEQSIIQIDARAEIVKASGVYQFLQQIRPSWQAKNLISRVVRLLPVDPSSACQRLLNAAIQDLREKIIIAGIDIAKEAADRFKLPPVNKSEDILENYSTSNIIDLAYRMGLYSRPDWRRLKRAYEIRRDLEHEDDEYEAEIEDLIYIFKTSIEIVLRNDPVELLRLSDVEELVEQPNKSVPSQEFLHDFEIAPNTRQKEILEYLINTALNSKKADIIRQNSIELLRIFRAFTNQQVLVEIGEFIQKRIKNKRLDLAIAKVANAIGVLPYLKQRQVRELFEWMLHQLKTVGYNWRQFSAHSKLLDDLEDIGGLLLCPSDIKKEMVLWMVQCYIGEPGGYGTMGRNRPVFYSNTAAPKIHLFFKQAGSTIEQNVQNAINNPIVKAAVKNKFIARRYESLLDLVSKE